MTKFPFLHKFLTRTVIATMTITAATAAWATNGYFAHGFGTANKGLGGAGVALPLDALAAADNPASIGFLGTRYDAGLAFFSPSRKYTVTGTPTAAPGTFGLAPGTVNSGSELFVIPHFGASWTVGGDSVLGLAVYGNGGMNTDYATNTYLGSSPTGIDLSQLFVATTYARRLGSEQGHSLGLSAILAFQTIEIQGTQAFAAFSSSPAQVANNGHEESFGVGARFGYIGQLTPGFSIAASYQTKVDMSEFDDYAGIFAERGDFDVPANATVGLAYRFGSSVALAADVQRIYYSDVTAIGNPLLPNLMTTQLGLDTGAGFGWDDMTVVKLGVQWAYGDAWTWRLGLATGEQPIRPSEVFPNIVAPAVVEEQITAGFSRRLAGDRALNLAVMYAPSNDVTGPNPLEVPGAQQIRLEMKQIELQLGYSWRFSPGLQAERIARKRDRREKPTATAVPVADSTD
jgi:long-chain fatty acid transport protein